VTTVLSFRSNRNPFNEHAALRNIETGAKSSKEVNVHQALEAGQNIIQESVEGYRSYSDCLSKDPNK
jgi:hypothetical protein